MKRDDFHNVAAGRFIAHLREHFQPGAIIPATRGREIPRPDGNNKVKASRVLYELCALGFAVHADRGFVRLTEPLFSLEFDEIARRYRQRAALQKRRRTSQNQATGTVCAVCDGGAVVRALEDEVTRLMAERERLVGELRDEKERCGRLVAATRQKYEQDERRRNREIAAAIGAEHGSSGHRPGSSMVHHGRAPTGPHAPNQTKLLRRRGGGNGDSTDL